MSFVARAIRRLFPLALLVLSPLAPAGEIDLRAPEEIAGLLSPFLPDETAPGAGGQARLQRLVRQILETEGYFSPQIEFVDSDGAVRLTVDPGPRTVIAAVDVAVDGPLAAKTRQELIAGWELPVGQPFRQQDWNIAKQQILSRLLADNHAAARLVDSQATIDPATRQARLMARYDSGPSFRFGELRVEGLERYPVTLVERHNRTVRPGEPFREADLNALQTTLQATPQFRSVQVSIDRDVPPDADGVVTAPVTVRLSERPAHRLSFGAGISSNTGARVETNFQTADLFGQAWELNTGLRLEQKKQTAYADVFFPPTESQRRNSVGAMLQATDIQGLRTERIAIGGQQAWREGPFETRLSLTWQDERLEPDGAPDSINRALVPNVAWTWRHVRQPARYPRRHRAAWPDRRRRQGGAVGPELHPPARPLPAILPGRPARHADAERRNRLHHRRFAQRHPAGIRLPHRRHRLGARLQLPEPRRQRRFGHRRRPLHGQCHASNTPTGSTTPGASPPSSMPATRSTT